MRFVSAIGVAACITLVASGCGSLRGDQQSMQDAQAPDVIYHNAAFVTANDAFDVVEAVASKDGRIVALGDADEVLAMAAGHTEIVDLGGLPVLPGFYDNHNHQGAGRAPGGRYDWGEIASKEDLLAALAAAAVETPAGEWIRGGLQNENMPQERLPDRWEMDAVAPNHPVHVTRGHISLANSRAIELAGVTARTPDPEGGSIERDVEGTPIGWFRESAGHRVIERVIPPDPPTPDSIATAGFKESLIELLSYGITSVNIPGVLPEELRWLQDTYAEWGDELPRATAQVRIRPGFDNYDDLEEGIRISLEEIEGLRFHTGFGNDRLKLGAIKMSVDGGFSAAAFWSTEPYPNHPDEEYYGVVRIPPDALYRVSKRAHDLGWQLGIHAIGDGAVEMVVDMYDRILRESPREDHRHYIHHFSVKPSEETLRKVAAIDMFVASQPNFTYSLGPYNASPGLTPERLATNNPQRSLRDLGIPVSFGSDGMPTGPLVGIYAAVTRRGVDGEVYGPEEAITIQEAIRGYTIESARLTFDEASRGTLEVGKYADMVVLSENPLTIDLLRLMEIQVDKTIVGGEILYSASDAPAVE